MSESMKSIRSFLILVLFIMIFFSCITYAATISGTVYDTELEPAENTIIYINTIPKQTIVSKDADYSFNVPSGNYNIEAKKGDFYTNETITVDEDGNYVLDLILWPSFEEEDEILSNIDTIEEQQESLPEINSEKQTFNYILAIIAVLILYVLFIKRKKIIMLFRKKRQIKTPIKNNNPNKNDEGYAEKIISFLKKEDGRATQKDIRKIIPLSEAKISLLLAELEHDRRIKKFRKGRSNIIVLKE